MPLYLVCALRTDFSCNSNQEHFALSLVFSCIRNRFCCRSLLFCCWTSAKVPLPASTAATSIENAKNLMHPTIENFAHLLVMGFGSGVAVGVGAFFSRRAPVPSCACLDGVRLSLGTYLTPLLSDGDSINFAASTFSSVQGGYFDEPGSCCASLLGLCSSHFLNVPLHFFLDFAHGPQLGVSGAA